MEKKQDFIGEQRFREEACLVPGEGESRRNPTDVDAEILIRKTSESDYDMAVELLFRRYYAVLCNHAVRYVSSRETAEDIVSDVFSGFYPDRSLMRIQTSFRAYLFTAVRNRAFNYVRLEMCRTSSIESAATVPVFEGQQPDSIVHFEDLYHDVERIINQLPLQRRKIYVMHRLEGKKYDEIAAELGISVKTVKEHMYRALQQVRDYLREKWLPALMIVHMYAAHLWNQL